MNEKDKELENILVSINNTINILDNKATSILVALGVVFGLSTMMIEPLFRKTTFINCQISSYVFSFIYLISSILCMGLLVATIYPRRGKKQFLYNKYYIDIYKNKGNIDFLTETPSEEQFLDQIKNCSTIAFRKDRLLRISIITLFLVLVSLLITVILMAFIISNPAK